MERKLIEKYDRILDETLKSVGNCLFVKDVMKLFPEIDKIEAENIIRDISENVESKKYFLFLKVDGGLNIASNSSTEILKRKGGFKFLFQNEKLTNVEIIEEIAELLREQGADSFSLILNKLHLDLPKVRINNLRAEIKRINYFDYNNSASSKDNISDLWLMINDKSECYTYIEYLEYEKRMSEKNNAPSIIYNTYGPNSPIQAGAKSTVTYNINNYESGQISEILDKLIEFVMKENSINTKDKRAIVKDLEHAQEKVNNGEVPLTLIEKILYYGDQFSSIGSFLGTILLTPSGQSAMLFLQSLMS